MYEDYAGLKLELQHLRREMLAQGAHWHCANCGFALENFWFCESHTTWNLLCHRCHARYHLRIWYAESLQKEWHAHETPPANEQGGGLQGQQL